MPRTRVIVVARARPPAAARWAGLLVAVACLGASANAMEPLPVPAAVAAPPLYVPGDFRDDGAAVPLAVALDPAVPWPRWFFGASGLVMTRTLDGGSATMLPLDGVQLSTADADTSTWTGGVDLHVGRWFGPRQHHAVEAIYWGIYNLGTSASVASDPPRIDAIPQAPDVLVGGTTATAFLLNASGQTIARSDVVNDVEINWLYSLWERPEFLPEDGGVNLIWLAGFRFFQVGDTLLLSSTAGDGALGDLDLGVATNNNLYGAQVGAKFDWRFRRSLRFSAVPKFMIAGNAITNTTTLESGSGGVATFPDGAAVSVHSNLGVFSWLGSVDTGLAWDVTDRWTLSIGYRVVGVGNIAQADAQWPALISSPDSLTGIDAGSSTIIHGSFAGFEGRY